MLLLVNAKVSTVAQVAPPLTLRRTAHSGAVPPNLLTTTTSWPATKTPAVGCTNTARAVIAEPMNPPPFGMLSTVEKAVPPTFADGPVASACIVIGNTRDIDVAGGIDRDGVGF